MAYGNVKDGIDFVAESQMRSRSLPDGCLSECELLPACQGGCRLQALIEHGDFNGVNCHYEFYVNLIHDFMRKKAAEALSGLQAPLAA